MAGGSCRSCPPPLNYDFKANPEGTQKADRSVVRYPALGLRGTDSPGSKREDTPSWGGCVIVRRTISLGVQTRTHDSRTDAQARTLGHLGPDHEDPLAHDRRLGVVLLERGAPNPPPFLLSCVLDMCMRHYSVGTLSCV